MSFRLTALALISCVPAAGAVEPYRGQAQIAQLGADVGAKLAAMHRGPVAVLPADASLESSRLGNFLVGDFTDALQRQGVRVLERRHLDLILREKKLDGSGLIDPREIQQLGRWARVRVLVHFVVVPLDRIQVRAVAWDIDTTDRLTGGLISVPRSPDLLKLLPPQERVPPPLDPRPAAVATRTGIQYELQSCRQEGTKISCWLTLTSRSRDQRVRLSLSSYVQDPRGRSYRASHLHTGKHRGWMLLLKGIKARVHVDFSGVSPEVGRLKALRLQGKGLDAEFHGVTVAR